ncbi:tail fiber protein [Shewanella sp. CG12_big_fil_rev_8_21_14_0_65_47_15]|uniref:phage tail protein n=1 Tax=Shewanella sp. CG12_big_fil_rev_8_21_14_0_65_47_15 TaxID=1975537 RepID=UPI000CB4654D|nr:tail fiber protein [Shewanella sp. CG12_big_fil_rev_8_21_14_0_65_47_15]PIW60182.1 MAG: phage tail protein [Shewanella sp. CG12_big_fil_rev_8_21_14_0_65_47_15]
MDPFIGEIRLLPFSFAPHNWALCNGQILSIASNTALFSIIGITYGGNGTTTFQLPNLQGQVVAGVGQGPGLRTWDWGEPFGENDVTLLATEMPAHNHTLTGLNNPGTLPSPAANTYLAKDGRSGGFVNYMQAAPGTLNTAMAPQTLGISGGGQAHENRQPFIALNYCIALYGVFPARN